VSRGLLVDLFGVTRGQMIARDTTRLLDAVIFNIAIGNVDSHAKNYSIGLSAGGRVQLAPLYELMSGLDWPTSLQTTPAGPVRGRRCILG
jgi:serine/threonine-protein kinase HipA